VDVPGYESPWLCDNGNVVDPNECDDCVTELPQYGQSAYYGQSTYYKQGTYYSQSTYYSQGTYYSQSSYYSQSTYYSQGTYAPGYSQSTYYSQATYYLQGTYYSQSTYYLQGTYYAQNSYTSSTPFLTVWDGTQYVFENDFLFGKPNTAFNTYDQAIAAYQAGIGGDTYVLKNIPHAEDGVIKMQIKEIEPEESFIDSFGITAVDVPSTYYAVADGNLTDLHVFDTNAVQQIEQQMHVYTARTGIFAKVAGAYQTLGGTQEGKDITLHTGDELLITTPINKEYDTDLWLLVDAHFRDWTLGNQVPFSALEQFQIQMRTLATAVPTLALGAVLATLGASSAQADTPYSQSTYSGYVQSAYAPKSLVVTAEVGTHATYLQTLFPRYVQASQEVVRIPKEIVKLALGSVLTLRIKATKKHKVRAAFLFAADTQSDASYTKTPLAITQMEHARTKTDVAQQVQVQDHSFVHTIPGDTISVTLQDAPQEQGTQRFYVLNATGFYTRISERTKKETQGGWYGHLDKEGRRLLKNLRMQ
jgi:hypothetical protein